jgi:hypothetical protein
MNSDEYVTVLFGEANPVSDAAAFASVVSARLEPREQWSETMTDTNLKIAEEQTKDKTRRGWLMGAAAAALILIVGVGTFVAFNDDPTPVDDAIPVAASGEFDIVGEWFITEGGPQNRTNLMRAVFEADGTYVIDLEDLTGTVELFDVGQYEIVDGVLTLTTTTSEHGNCEVGQVGVYAVSVASADQWIRTAISYECETQGGYGPYTHTRSP